MKSINPARCFILLLFALMSLPACKKGSSSGPAIQQWSIDSVTYTPKTVGVLSNTLYASDSIGLISFMFASRPASAGTYTIGDPATGPNRVAIEARTGDDYVSLSGSVKVDVQGGKISVDARDVRMLMVPMFTDTFLLSARLTEQ